MFSEYRNNNRNIIKKGKTFLIFVLFIMNISSLFSIKKYKYINSTKFQEFLPKINLNNDTIPSFNDIFNSRTLFISSNLTKEYIRYIRPIDKIEDKKYRKKYFVNISSHIFKKRNDQYN